MTPAAIRTAAASILARAAAAALELGNLPLGACDVQCAFECDLADFRTLCPGDRFEAAREHRAEAIRAALASLGYSF